MDDNILAKINRSTFKFLEPLSTQEVYKTIVEEAVKLAKARFGTIILEQNGKLVRVYASSPLIYKINIRPKGFTYKTFKSRKPLVIQIEEIAHVHPMVKKMGAKSSIYIPLSYKKKAIGVLIVQSRKTQPFSKKELDILKLFGSMASLAIRKTQLYDETRQALEVRDRFISMAAHELRTPLTTITGYIQLLFGKIYERNNIESKWIEQLSFESKRLVSLVKELLDVNNIKSDQLDFYLKECNLFDVINRAISNFRFNHPDRKLVFENKLSIKRVSVIGDFDKLLQVVSNLLDNAAKFSNSTPILLELYSNKDDFVVQVSDQGTGIKPENIRKVFQPFYKEEGNHIAGMGLGLHLAKHIVDYHKGQIKISSQRDAGTSVKIKLPKVTI